jgi:hypothetical protein
MTRPADSARGSPRPEQVKSARPRRCRRWGRRPP